MNKEEKPTFEEALKRLEQIVERMEKGDLGLDGSLSLFEEGIELSRICTHQLNLADQRVQKLVWVENGRFLIEPLDPETSGEQESKSS